MIVQATTPLVSAKIKDRPTGGIRSAVNQSTTCKASECNGPKRAITAAAMPKGGEEQVVSGPLNLLSRSWRGMKADKNQQNDRHPAGWQEPLYLASRDLGQPCSIAFT